MNVSEWATELVARHSADLSAKQANEVRMLIEDGDGWYAASAVIDCGIDSGWITERDLREALDLARRGAFSRSSASVERQVIDALARAAQ